ncbi:MAG: hypothetical protein ACK40L_08715 [Hydrogenophaga sp.]|jgi:Ca2+-binding EF-hand superfamily protein|nr:hypothetical protein [Hydrogenophaga sp.]
MSTAEGIGSSTASQWSPALASLGSALTTYLQDKMLKKVDADGNGGVEQSEFRAALEQLSGKLGVEMDESSEALFTSLDADSSGSLNGEEMGQLLRQVFAAPTSTQDFLNARGTETSDPSGFDALDTDGNGTLTRAEFDGSGPALPTTAESFKMVTTTTTTYSMVDPALASTLAGSDGAAAPAVAGGETDPLKALLASADSDRNGQITTSEVDQFIAQLASQMQLALAQFNDTQLASGETKNSAAA